MSSRELAAYRKSAKERQQKARRLKKQQKADCHNTRPEEAYKSPQSLGKAMRKSAGCLPKSPRKKKAVICGLAKKAGIEIKTNTTPSSNPGHSLTETEKGCQRLLC